MSAKKNTLVIPNVINVAVWQIIPLVNQIIVTKSMAIVLAWKITVAKFVIFVKKNISTGPIVMIVIVKL